MSSHAAGLVARSVEILRTHQAGSGAYPAAARPAEYRNCWLRDGAFIADALSRADEIASAEAFFAWCASIVVGRRRTLQDLVQRRRRGETVEPKEHLHCRYTVDGDDVPGEWPNFQLDGYGAWLWAVRAHAERHRRDVSDLAEAVELTLSYTGTFALDPMYDWWEERLGRHPVSLAAVHAGLTAGASLPFVRPDAAKAARRDATAILAAVRGELEERGRLARTFGGEELDASLVACATPFRLLGASHPFMAATVRALERSLAHGGVHRYAGDTYYGGGEWLLLAGLLGWHYAETGRVADARAQLDWMARHADERGELPEQVEDHLLAPDCLTGWCERWGPSASPLLWSHAMFVTLALALDGRR